MAAPGYYFCISPDSFLSAKHVESLVTAGDNPEAPLETKIFWADEGIGGSFWDFLTRPGFLTINRMLLIRQAHLLNAETWKTISAALGTPRPGILPVFFLECSWEKGAPKLPAHIAKLKCLTYAEKQGWVWKKPGLDYRSMPGYVGTCAKRKGLNIEPQALEILSAGLAPEAAAVDSSLDMLQMAAKALGKDIVTVELARQIGAHNPELVIFDFIRHLQSGHPVEVWKTLARESDGGESLLFPLLALLTREARQFWQELAGERVFFPPHVAQAKKAMAARLGRHGVAALFRTVMEAELAVKTGHRQPRQALEELVAGTGIIFRGGTRT